MDAVILCFFRQLTPVAPDFKPHDPEGANRNLSMCNSVSSVASIIQILGEIGVEEAEAQPVKRVSKFATPHTTSQHIRRALQSHGWFSLPLLNPSYCHVLMNAL